VAHKRGLINETADAKAKDLELEASGRTSVPEPGQEHLAAWQNAYAESLILGRVDRADHAPKPTHTAAHRHACRKPMHMPQAAWRTE